MYRKVVFSKDPTVLKLESANTSDDAAFIHLKHRTRAFYIGARRDQFGVYPGDLAISTLNQAYFTVTPVTSTSTSTNTKTEYELKCERIKTHQLACSTVRFTNDAHIGTEATPPGHLRFTVPSEHHTFQFGSRDDTSIPWVTLRSNVFHFNGDICCERIYTLGESTTFNTLPPSGTPSVSLDANGKIPMEYLPEIYKTSLLHNTTGVGIGTECPLHKFHLEGSGFIRGRLIIGEGRGRGRGRDETEGDAAAPAATLHLRPPSATPAIRVEATDIAPVLEVYGDSLDSPVVQIGLREAYFQPPIRTTVLTTDTLVVPNQMVFQHRRVNILSPTHIQAPLTVCSIASEDAKPLILNAPSVECSNLNTRHWTLPLTTEASSVVSESSKPPSLPMTFQAARLSLGDGTLTLDDAAWKAAYESGDELAKLTMTDASHIDMTRVIAFLWNTVQELRQRIQDLENKS